MTLLLQCLEIALGCPPNFKAAFTKLKEMPDAEMLAAVADSSALIDDKDPAVIRGRLRRAVNDVQDAWVGNSQYGYSTTLSTTDLLVMGGDCGDGNAQSIFDSAELFLCSQLYSVAGFFGRNS